MGKNNNKNKTPAPQFEPIFSMPVYSNAIYLDIYPVCWAPVIYSLVLLMSAKGIDMAAKPMVHQFSTFEARNNYLTALTYAMKFQHADPRGTEVIAAFKKDIDNFRTAVKKIDKEKEH